MTQYQSGTIASGVLTGSERVSIDNGGAVQVTCTTAQIAALANEGDASAITEVAIITAASGTLTAAGLVAGQIARTGPTKAFSDVTASAAQIVALLPEFVVGGTFFVRIKNGTQYEEILQAGAGVTLPANNIVPPFSTWWGFGTVGGTSSVPTVVFTHMATAGIYGTLEGSPQIAVPTGATQGGAAAITSLNVIVAVNATASTRGVRLFAGFTGLKVSVANGATFPFKVYPATGCKIGAAATNAADTVLAVNKMNVYRAISKIFWVVQRGA
jgi:hypothetical protein